MCPRHPPHPTAQVTVLLLFRLLAEEPLYPIKGVLHYISNHNLIPTNVGVKRVVSYSVPISNHNLSLASTFLIKVVSYSVPISNHNLSWASTFLIKLYLILFLYQTTTALGRPRWHFCCILFCSYIKPQPFVGINLFNKSCILFCSYIKPQPCPTVARSRGCCILFCSYIKPQLFNERQRRNNGCILFCSYIKPQRTRCHLCDRIVVSYSVPISNHNLLYYGGWRIMLYLILFLYQTTTVACDSMPFTCCILFCSYIKPQRNGVVNLFSHSCILFCSYIKPQRVNS